MRNPGQILYDGYSNPVAIKHGDQILVTQPGYLAVGKDDSDQARFLSTTTAGVLKTADVGSRVKLGEYYASSKLLIGDNSEQNLLSLENPSGSGINCFITRIITNGTVNSSSNLPFLYKLSRTDTLPTDGYVQVAEKQLTDYPNPKGVIRATPVTDPSSGVFWSSSPGTLTSAGASPSNTFEAMPFGSERREIKIKPGEAILVYADSNSTDWRHWVNIQWYEEGI